MKTITYYRVTESNNELSRYGDTIAIEQKHNTDIVYNLTTGKQYTRGGEQGTIIKSLDNFPLFESELANKKAWGI